MARMVFRVICICKTPAMHSYLSYQMHRRLANAKLYLPILHGASGRGTFENVGKPILNKVPMYFHN